MGVTPGPSPAAADFTIILEKVVYKKGKSDYGIMGLLDDLNTNAITVIILVVI